jgi:hypothetical protein
MNNGLYSDNRNARYALFIGYHGEFLNESTYWGLSTVNLCEKALARATNNLNLYLGTGIKIYRDE